MNEKLWKIIQYTSIIVVLILVSITFLIADYTPRPGGGWNATFPSKGFQYTTIVFFFTLTPLFIFATYVRIEKEVSFYVLYRTIFSIVFFGGLHYLVKYMMR